MPPNSPLNSVVLDHVAVAVDDLAKAHAHWRALGAAMVSGGEDGGFATEQLRLSNGGKIELIAPSETGSDSFITAFLRKFGAGRIHHITLKVPGPLSDAVAQLAAAGYPTVDHSEANPFWHEAFVPPAIVGGLIVQIAWSGLDDAAYAAQMGRPPPEPIDRSSPQLERVRLQHPDLDAAAALWTALGATLDPAPARGGDGFVARFTDSPISVEVVEAAKAGPVGLLMPGTDPAPASAVQPDLLGG